MDFFLYLKNHENPTKRDRRTRPPLKFRYLIELYPSRVRRQSPRKYNVKKAKTEKNKLIFK